MLASTVAIALCLAAAPAAVADDDPLPPPDATTVPGETTAAPEPAPEAAPEAAPETTAPATPTAQVASKDTIEITLEPATNEGGSSAPPARTRRPVAASRFDGNADARPGDADAADASTPARSSERPVAPVRARDPSPAREPDEEPASQEPSAALAGATVAGGHQGARTGAAVGPVLPAAATPALADVREVVAEAPKTGFAVIGLVASIPGAILLVLALFVPAVGRWRRIPPYRWAGLRFTAVTIGAAWLLASILVVVVVS